MSRRGRLDPRRVKLHLSYTIEELARALGCHKNSVRHWLKQGLSALEDGKRPTLIAGSVARAFLEQRRCAKKRRCDLHELYCLRCREPREARPETLKFEPGHCSGGMLRGDCSSCGTQMFKRISGEGRRRLSDQLELSTEAGAPTLKQAA